MTIRQVIRQVFCRHDWSCGMSRKCDGDHYCLKCGYRPKGRAAA